MLDVDALIRHRNELLDAIGQCDPDADREQWLTLLTSLRKCLIQFSVQLEPGFEISRATPAFQKLVEYEFDGDGNGDTPLPDLDKSERLTLSEQLEALAQLRESGIITGEEYLDITDRALNHRKTPMPSNKPAILDAILAGDMELLEEIIDRMPQAVNMTTTHNGWTPLHIAAAENDAEAVKTLLQAGAEPDSKSTNGKTALLHAASRGHVNVVRLLLDFGANVAIEYKGRTAVERARKNGHDEITKLIKRHARTN